MSAARSFFTTLTGRDFFRGALLAFAFVLACQAAWILTAETSRLPRLDFPTTAQAAAVASANRDVAGVAASFGVIRGDLWAEYALTYLNVLRYYQPHGDAVEHAREAADRALALAPHNARVWLILAVINSRLGQKSAVALRMSYYTGASEVELIPLRLHLAVNSKALAEKDFQELVRHDIRTIVTRKPELKPAILAAYRDALPTGRQFLEEALKEIDPALTLRPEE